MDEWEYTMKKLILFLLIAVSCFSQGYDETIDSYTFYFLQTEDPVIQCPGSVTTSVEGDAVLTFAWENGTPETPPYITPNTGTYTAMVVLNDPSLWTSGSAVVARDVVLESGLYEVTLICADVEGNQSGHSEPLYLDITHKTARVIINLRVIE